MASDTPTLGDVLALMYARWTLDCVVSAAHAVSWDFSSRPQLYDEVAESTAGILTDIQGSTGFHPGFPSLPVRETILTPLFGKSDGRGGGGDGSAFQTTRMAVLSAAAAFSENAQPIGFPMHRERIRSALVPFRTHMKDIAGASQKQTDARTAVLFDRSVEALRDTAVAAVFGIQGRIDQSWPIRSTNAEGAKLIAFISEQLSADYLEPMTRDSFIRLQRVARKGEQSIRLIVDGGESLNDETIDKELTPALYAWGSDLGVIGMGKKRT